MRSRGSHGNGFRASAWTWIAPALTAETTQLLGLAVLVGSLSGLLSILFWRTIHLLDAEAVGRAVAWLDLTLGAPLAHPMAWRALFPALGALVMALLVHRVFRTPERLGVAGVMFDARTDPGSTPLRYLPATFVAGALIIGTGGSAGREAPVVAMGGVLGGWVGRRLGLSPRKRQVLMGCGTGAAIAAAFNAPMAGLFFALELILGDYAAATLSPVLLASVAGTVVCRALEGEGASHFQVPPYHLGSWWEIGLYAGLGVLAGLAAPVFVRTDRGISRWFSRLRLAREIRPALGGLAVGALALVLPQVMGNGYEHVEAALGGHMALGLLAALAAGKIVATALTLGSGGWGGDFAPLLFIGAMLGGAYGSLMVDLFPGHGLTSSPYAMVGMGAMVAATVRAPMTAILLLFELTASYQVILPVMTACAVATVVARVLLGRGLYHEQLAEMGGPASEVPEARLLETVKVGEVMRSGAVTLAAGAPYREILRVIATSDQLVFPVLRDDGTLLGALTFRDLRRFLDAVELEDVVVAADVASEEIPVLTVNDPLERAMQLFAEHDLEELPVVQNLASRRFVGLLTRRQVLAARARLLAEWEMEGT